MGAEIIGSAILGGSALIGTGATMLTNKSNQAYGSEQSEESRKWATNERLASQEYNTQERLATQEYNDPVNQAMKLRSAGLNPSAMSNGVRFVGSPPQSSSPGSAGGISPMGTNQVPNIPQLISSGSDLVNALSKHKETEASLPLIGEEVKYYVQKTYGEQLSNDLMKIEKEFKQSTLPAFIKKVHEEVAKLEFEKIAVEKQGKVFDQEAKLKEAQLRLTEMQEKLTGEQAIQSHYLTDNWHRITDAMLQLQKSETTANYASAQNQSSQAEQNKIFNKIYSDKRYQHSVVTQAVEAGRQAVQQSKISKSQAEQMNYLVEQAAYANDMKEFTYWSDQINQFVNTLGSAASQFYGAGALRELINIRKGQQIPPVSVQGFK